MPHTATHRVADRRSVQEGDLLWTPSPERVEHTRLTAFTRFAEERTGRTFDDYAALWQCWFTGARLNFAEHVLRMQRPGEAALLHAAEDSPLRELPWEQFTGQVRAVATHLRSVGVRPGDRVVAYLPNVPEAMVAMLAAASVGAVWAGVSPDFGARGALDRLGQLGPTVLFATDGYRYGGREFDRRSEVADLVAGLPTLREVVCVPVLGLATPGTSWAEVIRDGDAAAEEFAREQVPFDHPLWVLFSSGTTGLPKPIVHGHGGILLEHLKLHVLHHDLRPGDRAFFFTTTGWMMWNFLVSMPLVGAAPVLYDGNPSHPDVDVLWRIAQDSRARLFGASPTFVELMQKAGVVPRERFELFALDVVMPAGSPVAPATTAWFYTDVKDDLSIATGSGGTDVCTGLVGGVPTLPVRAGEIQARSLGVAAEAWDDAGHPVVGQVGELVITRPMPSMPLFFWGDCSSGARRTAPGTGPATSRPFPASGGTATSSRSTSAAAASCAGGPTPSPTGRACGSGRRRSTTWSRTTPPSPVRSWSTSTCPAADSSCRCSSSSPPAPSWTRGCDGGCARSTPRGTYPTGSSPSGRSR
jgi:acetoacetyl-CoA synthetase